MNYQESPVRRNPIYKRLETDYELRTRCRARATDLLMAGMIATAMGHRLDEVANSLGLQRRIVEDGL